MNDLLRALLGRGGKPSKPRRTSWPELEMLEDRTTPSATSALHHAHALAVPPHAAHHSGAIERQTAPTTTGDQTTTTTTGSNTGSGSQAQGSGSNAQGSGSNAQAQTTTTTTTGGTTTTPGGRHAPKVHHAHPHHAPRHK